MSITQIYEARIAELERQLEEARRPIVLAQAQEEAEGIESLSFEEDEVVSESYVSTSEVEAFYAEDDGQPDEPQENEDFAQDGEQFGAEDIL